MGCDIHLHFERKNKDGSWDKIHIDSCLLPDDRNYDIFAFLAGVRNFGENPYVPIFPERGIPVDCSYNKEDWEDGCYHSETYAYLNEILEAPWENSNSDNEYFIVFCRMILPRLLSKSCFFNSKEKKNIRVIMGFDN